MVIQIPNTFIKTISLLSLILYLLVITTTANPNSGFAEEVVDQEEDPEFYILDETPSMFSNVTISSKTRMLVSHYKKIKKGMECHVGKHNICNGVKANKGKSLLRCCKKHCRDVLADKNNCGRCDHKCGFGQQCCDGVCRDILADKNNCGRCHHKCGFGQQCCHGVCRDILADKNNCGRCHHKCGFGQQCCHGVSRDILADKNNCGRCHHKCGFGQQCCHGVCTHVSFNRKHCGKCKRKCAKGVKCEYGYCGYA